jgi:two-component system NtrC family sensor kinase
MKASPKPLAEEQVIWHMREMLTERLSEVTNLPEAGQAVLQVVLETLERPGGILMIHTGNLAEPYLVFSRQLNPSWAQQLQEPGSPLQQFARHILEAGEAFPVERSGRDHATLENLAAAFCISAKGSSLGALLIQGDPLQPEKYQRLEALMAPMSRGLHAARQIHDIQERAKELASLQTELTRMGFNTDIEILQARMLQGASQILDGEHSALILLDDKNSEWIVRKTLGEGNEWAYQINPKSGKGLIRDCLQSGETVRSANPIQDPRYDPGSDTISGYSLQSMICAPLVIDGRVLGAIQIVNKRSSESFNAFDQDLLAIIAALAANALQGTRLIQKLKVANADLEASRWELLGSRNTLRALFDNLPTAMYIIDPEYTIMAINQVRARVLGEIPKSLVGKICYQSLFNRPTPCPDCRVQETFREKNITQRKESRLAKSESTDWEISTYPICDEDGKVIQAILLEQDITEQQRLEGILAQSEKLAAIGQLAAGVAHEINNPLTAIIANAQILQRELPADSDLQESIDLISRAGARATQVVRNLLDFARKEDYHLGLTDVNETLQRSLDLMQHEILARGVQVAYDPDPNLSTILASQDHLQSVWLNLLLNAIDALDKTPREIRVTTRKFADEIHVSVADNGKGIAPERLTRIFEPFYTTKEPGRGTGLGLSVCHRIVRQHGGHIRVESQVGIGSEFTVILPMS